jgi:MFS family permease
MSTVTVRPRLVTKRFAGVGLAAMAYFFAEGMLVPAVPRYVAGPLGGGDAAVGLVVGAFSVSALALRPWAGRLADRRGRVRLMVIGAALYGVAVAAYSVADSVTALLALRVLTGVGEAFFFVGALTAISDLAPEERRGEAMSLFSLSLYGGIALGPPAAEAIAARFGFTAVWLVATAAAATAVVLAVRAGETRTAVPVRPARLLHPAAVLPAVLLLAAIWGMACFLAFVPLYALDLGLGGSGVLLFVFAGIVIAVRSFGARLPDRLGAGRAVRIALAGIAGGLTVIGSWRTVPGLVTGTVVLAAGVALATPAIFMLALDGIPPSERGAVMGVVSMSLDLALGLGPVVFGFVATATDRGTAFLATAVVAAAGFALISRPDRRKDSRRLATRTAARAGDPQ